MNIEIIVASAPWCTACAAYKPQVQKYVEKQPANLKITYREVDIEKDPAFAAKHGIQGLPTTLLMRQGQVVGRFSGAVSVGMLDTRVRTAGV